MGLHVFLLIDYSQILIIQRYSIFRAWATGSQDSTPWLRDWTGWSPEALSNFRHPCESPVSFLAELSAACWLQRYSFTQVQGYFVKCFLGADILLHTHFTALHSQDTDSFLLSCSQRKRILLLIVCAISQCLVNGTNCHPLISFFLPFMPVLKVFEILFSYQSSTANIASNAKFSLWTLFSFP